MFDDDITQLATEALASLKRRKERLASAESCSGGLLAGALTDIPGASDAFLGGIVAYDNSVKRTLLDLPEALLADEGAVSAAVAVSMATAARRLLRSDWALATTGIAGPGGGSQQKPVGLVFIALSGANGAPRVERHQLAGNRAQIRHQTVALSLRLLLSALTPGE